ncbi:hypothetical protein ABT301_26295 [Streptomyces sp. NPDC000987]|uniref:hypothetical protein n=1 Tax=Streptomyces sp. NPDC000987 TaxID=3154374 RepID=UPI0033275F4E
MDRRVVLTQAGSVLLTETVRKTGLDAAFSEALAPWRKDRAVMRISENPHLCSSFLREGVLRVRVPTVGVRVRA